VSPSPSGPAADGARTASFCRSNAGRA
jgi:hypothetical protein